MSILQLPFDTEKQSDMNLLNQIIQIGNMQQQITHQQEVIKKLQEENLKLKVPQAIPFRAPEADEGQILKRSGEQNG